MKRIFGWLAGAVGGAAVYRAVRRKPVKEESSPADELRAKLAETKLGSDAAGSDPAVPADPEARRAAVHEQGRAAIDELRGD